MAMVDILKGSELFGGLGVEDLEKVAVLCRGGSYQQGTNIFNEGDEAIELYILTSGRVALEMDVRPVPDRPTIPTAVEIVTEGECFGWSALVEPYVYTLSARCMTNCTTLAIKGDMLQKAMSDDSLLGYGVMKRLARLISLRLTHTRVRLTSGLGLIMLGKEWGISK